VAWSPDHATATTEGLQSSAGRATWKTADTTTAMSDNNDPQDDGLISLIADAITADAANPNRLDDVRIAGTRRTAGGDTLWATWT
jgi:hypothetical protein